MRVAATSSLPIDFRGYGLSQARTGAAATRFPSDLAAATKALRKLGKKKVFLVGASMGGVASLVAAANVKPAVTGVVSVSAPARFRGMDALETAKRLRVPVLYLAAEEDDNAGFDFAQDAETMHAATASSDKRLEVLPGSLHGIAPDGRLRARAKAAVESFLQDALSPDGGSKPPPGSALLTADGEVAVSSRSAARRRVRAMRVRAGLDPARRWVAAERRRSCCRS